MSQLPPHPPVPPQGHLHSGPAAGADLPPHAPRRRTRGLVLAVILLVVALAGSTTVAVVQSARLADQRDQVAQLQRRAEQAEEQARQAQAELDRAQAATDPLGALGELFGEGGLEDLFGGGGGEDSSGDLGGLFGEDGLGGLFGEGGLEGLFGDTGASPDVTACITDVPDIPDVGGATLQEQFAEAAAAVERLRGHTFPEPLDPELMTAGEIEAFFRTYLAEEYPADVAETDRLIMGLLRAVPIDIDLLETQIGLLGDQVAGFYDDETGQLVVRADDADAPLGGTGLIVLAHELEHALVDAAVGLPDLAAFEGDDDGAVAALSVVEGSAVTLQSQFQVSALNPLSLLGDLGALLGADQGLDQVPAYLRESLLFPYVVGPTYVCGLHQQGGWPAVDAAVQDPPATTHALMFPDSAVGDPVAVPQPDGPSGYALDDRRTFGAAQLSWLFAAPGDAESAALADPVGAVAPWRGGEVSLWTEPGGATPGAADGAALALVLSGADLCEPVAQWWAAAAGGADGEVDDPTEREVRATPDGTWGVVTCDGDDVRVGIAGSAQLARDAIS